MRRGASLKCGRVPRLAVSRSPPIKPISIARGRRTRVDSISQKHHQIHSACRLSPPLRYQKYHTFHTCGVTPSAINTRILHAHCADIYFQRGECACAADEDDASSIQIAGVSNTSPRARLVGVVTLIWGPLVVRRHRGDTASSRRMRVHARAFGPTPNKGESMRRGLTEHATATKMCTLQTHALIPKHSARTHASACVHASTTSTQPAQRVQEI